MAYDHGGIKALKLAVAIAVHIFGAVIWVGGMFAIYVSRPPRLILGTQACYMP
jgi:uncharacterized membrane protein